MADSKYYYADASKKPVGPYTLEELHALASRGAITSITKVIAKGEKSWMAYSQLPKAPVAAASTPPVAAPNPSPAPSEPTAEEGGSFLSAIPKPLFFGLIGAIGCLLGGLMGEPVLLTLKGDSGPASADGETAGNAAPVLVFSPEIKERLEREKAEAGAIEIALVWNTTDDLDLHCVDPGGNRIFFNSDNKRSPTGGWLDVDMNAEEPFVAEPVEHIRWKKGEFPEGKYHVCVHFFGQRSGRETVPYTVMVKVHDKVKEYTGSATFSPMGLGGSNPTVEGFLAAAQFIDVTNFDAKLEPEPETEPAPVVALPPPSIKAALIMGVWTALLAVFTSLLLVMGQNYLLRKPLITAKAAMVIVVGGVFAGLISGVTSQYLFSLGAQSIIAKFPDMSWLLKVGLVVGWMLLGLLLGIGIGWFIPNLSKIRSGFAGVIGGFLGALAFLLAASVVADLMGRIIGTFILGFSIGLMVALVEQLMRKAWLTVFWTANQHSNINLGAKPVTIGGGSDDIRIKGLGENALSIILSDGRILCTQQPGNKETELKDQSVLNLGKTRLVVHAQKEE